MASVFKRPAAAPDDPEAAYRAGYQHGAVAALKAVAEIRGEHVSDARFLEWTDSLLQTWRHDRNAPPRPPAPPNSRH
jgi:hypothetical protein